MESLYVVMPAYNEEENIEKVVEQWYPIVEDKGDNSRMIVADSGSSDATHDILLMLKEKYNKLEILSNTGKQHGPKLIALYNYAIKNGADYIFQTDSDGQTDPREFEEFWSMRNNYDAILGHREVRGDGKYRAFVEKVVCFIIRLYFGVKVPDANAPFRLMKTKAVQKHIHRLPIDYNLPNIMMTTYFKHYQDKLAFKTITFMPRQGGKNTINIQRIIKIGWKALSDFRILKRRMKGLN